MDNRLFNVNGNGDQLLLCTLRLVFEQVDSKCKGWVQDEDNGLVLLRWCDAYFSL